MGEDGRGEIPFLTEVSRAVLTHIALQEYRAGRLLTGQLKAKCIQVLQDFVKGFQEVYYQYLRDDQLLTRYYSVKLRFQMRKSEPSWTHPGRLSPPLER